MMKQERKRPQKGRELPVEDLSREPVKNKIRVRREIYVSAALISLLFIALAVYLFRFEYSGAKDFIYNNYNSRFSVFSDDIIRGSILTSDDTIIATTQESDGKQIRYYPYKGMFAHAIGYTAQGMAGLEAQYSFDLLKSHTSFADQINNDLTGAKTHGDNLYTTLDYDTQEAAYEGFGMFDGALIAIEPDTGKVIAMVSKPSFDPNNLAENWEKLTAEDSGSSVLVNRATQGAYPPGSTFKIVSTVAYLRANSGSTDFSYNCKGSFKLDDQSIHCSSNEVHGKEDLKSAFYNSCNSAFATIGSEIDKSVFCDTAESLLFNTSLPTQLSNTKKSRFTITDESEDFDAAQTAIGQGDTTVSPLHMAMLVSAIANDGQLMEPYIVDRLESADGDIVTENQPLSYGQIFSTEEVSILQEYMRAVVEEGTAKKVDFGDLTVYGKTGTAEYNSNKDNTHSWFVGYAENAQGKKLAIAVIMEGAGYGSKHAAPLAADVFNAYFN